MLRVLNRIKINNKYLFKVINDYKIYYSRYGEVFIIFSDGYIL